jgi:ribose/xylose/arabinose/galactoside ABC-type transport system permease subunit
LSSVSPALLRSARRGIRVRGWLPLALMALLMVALGGYAYGKQSSFASQYNLNSLLLAALPLAFVALAQANVLLVGGFDISVGALMTLCVVVGSFSIKDGLAWYYLVPGSLALLALGLVVGFANGMLVKVVRLPSIIATLATLSILQGIALRLRPVAGGAINGQMTDALNESVSFLPYAFIGVLVLAALGDFWLYRTTSGLTLRAVGFDEHSSRRVGAASTRIQWRAFVVASLLAAVGAFFLAVLLGTGDATPGTGTSFTLQSIAAAVLGGASLAGGRASFVGAVFGAVFLSLITNILPFVGWSDYWGQISIGGLTLLALVLYQGTELWARLRALWRDLRRGRLAAAAQRA